MKMLCEKLITAIGSYGAEAALPDPEPREYEGWEVTCELSTNRYINPEGERLLQVVGYFSRNGKWLFLLAREAYRVDADRSEVLRATREAIELPNKSPAWMAEYELNVERKAIDCSVRSCVAGNQCFQNVVQHLLDDIIQSADYYFDLFQLALRYGQFIPEVIQNSGYVAARLTSVGPNGEMDSEGEREHDANDVEEQYADEFEAEEQSGDSELRLPPRGRQLPWE
jgi:hypothetical protein